MPIELAGWITRDMVRKNPHKTFVFGDNFAGWGLGGQAKEMRGESNAFGIPTKLSPKKYLSDEDYELCKLEWTKLFNKLHAKLYANKIIVWPRAGIGIGRAKLSTSAPRCFDLLQEFQGNLFSLDEQLKHAKNSN